MKKILTLVALSLILGLGLKMWVVEIFTVPTDSMEPTILRGSKAALFKLPFLAFGQGNVVGFERNNEYFVKRIVAEAGDSVYFDGRNYQIYSPKKFVLLQPITIFKIPKKGETIHFDSQNFSFYQPLIERNEGTQAGMVLNQIFINNSLSNNYTFKNDYFFLQGDNTEGSTDSRHFGLIGRNQIVGKVWF